VAAVKNINIAVAGKIFSPESPMTNHEVAAVFKEIADILKLKGEDWFKIRAYLKVIQVIEQLQEPVEKIVKEGRAREIPGVGDAIEKKLNELVATGKLAMLERLKSEFPEYKGV
jgi:DNA polymerase (family 10)